MSQADVERLKVGLALHRPRPPDHLVRFIQLTGEEAYVGITRINQFEAKPGSGEKLHAFLQSVISIIATCPGAISCRLLRSTDNPASLAIIEEWDSIESHQSAARAIPPEKMAEANALFARPPTGAYYKA